MINKLRDARNQNDRHRRSRGYILLMFCLSLLLLLSMVGLAVDLGRMYVVRSEAQSFADAASLRAVVQVAQHPGTFASAATAAAQTPKRWDLG